MDIYKLIRKKVGKLKKKSGFKCKICGSCCTASAGLFDEDFIYMKKKGVNLKGIKTLEFSDGSLMPLDLKHKLGKFGLETGICFYEKEVGKGKSKKIKCSIHPNNPLVCHTFPFVVNLSTKFFMVKDSCTWMKENYKSFSVNIKKVDEIRDLIEGFHIALKNYEAES